VPVLSNGKDRQKFKRPEGYNKTKYNGELWPSHRLSYHLNKEPIPIGPGSRKEGLVLHTCDNKWCINPDHLYLGTAKQNAKDNAKRNADWRRKRSEIQKKIGFPEVSPDGRRRMAEKKQARMKLYSVMHPEEMARRAAAMREAQRRAKR